MLLEKLTSLAKLTDALSRATSAEEVYAASLNCLQESLGVERASILLFDADDVMSFVAWRGISDDYRRAVNGHTPWRPETENCIGGSRCLVFSIWCSDPNAEYRPNSC